MQRTKWMLIGFVAMVGVACQPPQPPASYVAPVIDSVVISPNPVTAGSTVQITIRAHDDETITGVTHNGFRLPQGTSISASDAACSSFSVQPDGPGAIVATSTCTIPSAGNNGTWTVMFNVVDSQQWAGGLGSATFQVVGGGDDVTGPAIQSAQYYPGTSNSPATNITFRARLTDATAPIHVLFWEPYPTLYDTAFQHIMACSGPTFAPISAGVVEMVVGCTGNPTNPPGPYSGSVRVYDGLGNRTDVPISVTVV